MLSNEKILERCNNNLIRGRVIATGVGIFVRAVDGRGRFPVRIRTEKGSIIGQDLSGKWEIPGGGVDVCDFADPGNYQQAVFKTAQRELAEEVGLLLIAFPVTPLLIPVWLGKPEDGLFDLAFVLDIPCEYVEKTDRFNQMLANGEVILLTPEEVIKMDPERFISQRMYFMASQPLIAL